MTLPGCPVPFPHAAGKGWTVVCDDGSAPGEYVFTVFAPDRAASASLAFALERGSTSGDNEIQLPASVYTRLAGLAQLLTAHNLF